MSTPKWFTVAKSKLGTKEVPGDGSNSEILGWIRDDLGVDWYVNDGIPWCAGFANWCLKQAGEATTGSLMARSFLNYGTSCKPQLGAILVFKRGKAPQGHVGFYVRETETQYVVLGGNQSNMVKEAFYPKSDLLAARWPTRKSNSKVIQGAALAGLGTTGTTVAGGADALSEIASQLSDGSYQLQPLVEYSSYIGIVCAVLAFIGVGLSIYGRVKMMRNERAAGGESGL